MDSCTVFMYWEIQHNIDVNFPQVNSQVNVIPIKTQQHSYKYRKYSKIYMKWQKELAQLKIVGKKNYIREVTVIIAITVTT